MRRLFISFIAFLLFATSAMAEVEIGVVMSVATVNVFQVNNVGPLTFTFDEYSDFGIAQDIGDIDYDLDANAGWQVSAIILDGTQNGQTADDWDDVTWTLSVNGVAINESSGTVIDSDPGPVSRTGALWEVLLTIPWPESASTPDCTIQLTASDL